MSTQRLARRFRKRDVAIPHRDHTADSPIEAAAQSQRAIIRCRMPPAIKFLVWPGTWGCCEESLLCTHTTYLSVQCFWLCSSPSTTTRRTCWPASSLSAPLRSEMVLEMMKWAKMMQDKHEVQPLPAGGRAQLCRVQWEGRESHTAWKRDTKL